MYGFYEVQPGDQLFQILRDAYGAGDFLNRKAEMVEFVRANNPGIKDINKIYPGQIIILPVDPDPDKKVCSVVQLPPVIEASASEKLRVIPEKLQGFSADTRKLITAFGEDTFQDGSEMFMNIVEKRVKAAIPDLRRVPLEYLRKEAGTSSVKTYNAARRSSIKSLEKKLGFLEPLVFNTKKAREVLRIERYAPNRIHRHLKELENFERIGKVAKFGGKVVSAVKLAGFGSELASAPKREDKIGVIADYAGSIATGLIFAAVVATPVGWVGIAAVAIGGVVVSTAGGAVAETLAEGLIAGNWKSIQEQLLD